VRSYRFYGFAEEAAAQLATVLNEDGLTAEIVPPGADPLPGWGVFAEGDDRSEGLLEMLAGFYGGSYEGEGLSGA